MDRDELGRLVHDIRVAFCRAKGDTNPAHLVGWEELDEDDREIDRRIGETLYDKGYFAGYQRACQKMWGISTS